MPGNSASDLCEGEWVSENVTRNQRFFVGNFHRKVTAWITWWAVFHGCFKLDEPNQYIKKKWLEITRHPFETTRQYLRSSGMCYKNLGNRLEISGMLYKKRTANWILVSLKNCSKTFRAEDVFLQRVCSFAVQILCWSKAFVCFQSQQKQPLTRYCWWKKSCTSWYGKNPIIYRVEVGRGNPMPYDRFYTSQVVIAGFLNHQQYEFCFWRLGELTMFKLPHFPSNHWFFAVLFLTLGIQSPKLRMIMEPKYLSQEVTIHPNHHLTRWLDP